MNRDQRIAVLLATAFALYGVAQAVMPFTVSSFFAAQLTCGPPIVAFDDEPPDLPEDFVEPLDADDLDSCRDGARRRLTTAGTILVFAAGVLALALRLLASPDDAPPPGSTTGPSSAGDQSSLGADLPPYASEE